MTFPSVHRKYLRFRFSGTSTGSCHKVFTISASLHIPSSPFFPAPSSAFFPPLLFLLFTTIFHLSARLPLLPYSSLSSPPNLLFLLYSSLSPLPSLLFLLSFPSLFFLFSSSFSPSYLPSFFSLLPSLFYHFSLLPSLLYHFSSLHFPFTSLLSLVSFSPTSLLFPLFSSLPSLLFLLSSPPLSIPLFLFSSSVDSMQKNGANQPGFPEMAGKHY